jgi:predicted PurR-regulated permease PerM
MERNPRAQDAAHQKVTSAADKGDSPFVLLSQLASLRRETRNVQTAALVIVAFAVVLFLLVQARFLLISLATAIVLFSLMSDAIDAIGRVRVGPLRVPTWLASIAAVILVSAFLLALSAVILSQINTVLVTTLTYADQSQRAIAEAFRWMGEDVEAAVLSSMRSVDIPAYLRTMAGQAGSLLAATVLIILFVGFLFVERIWFATKLNALVGDPARGEKVRVIIATIIHRVNRYLLVKTLVSAVTGAMVYGVALVFGLELAVPLGIITFVLNFIPNVGSIVATLIVALVAYVQLGDLGPTAAIFAIAGLIQFVNGNIIDPMLMGRALRLSSFGIIISLAFWSAVWGVPGMFLSVPIMVGLMIICAEIPALRPLAILLSREGFVDDTVATSEDRPSDPTPPVGDRAPDEARESA